MRKYFRKRARYLVPPLLERWFRLRDRVSLAGLALTGRSTVKNVINRAALDGDRAIIFVTYPSEKLASCHARILKLFEERGYSVIISTNHSAPERILADQLSERWCFLIRRPFGRDFGCYKDASLLLYDVERERGRPFNRVVYLNDSVITFSKTEQDIVDHLDNDEFHCSGLTENYDKGYHLSSYAVAMSSEVFHHKRIEKYWRTFLPISTRRHAIGKGELGLSRALKKAGYQLHVHWSLGKIKDKLLTQDFATVHAIANSMEPDFRGKYPSLVQIYDRYISEMRGPDGLSPLNEGNSRSRNSKTTMLEYREQYFGLLPDTQKSIARASAHEEMVDTISRYIFRGSQIHHGAAPLLFLGAGILKKDVVLRKIVEPFNIKKLLLESGACDGEECEEAAREVLAKGHPYSLRGKARLMHDWDFT